MKRVKIIFILLVFVSTMFYLIRFSCGKRFYRDEIYGQAYIEFLNNSKINSEENQRYISKRYLYSGSINIIEKYLTIYMILYIIRYYVRCNSIRREIYTS